MKLNFFLAVLMMVPGVAVAATRDSASVRVGVSRANQVGARMPSMVAGTTQMVTNTSVSTSNPTLSKNPNTGRNSSSG